MTAGVIWVRKWMLGMPAGVPGGASPLPVMPRPARRASSEGRARNWSARVRIGVAICGDGCGVDWGMFAV
jgi:hypothetical protein